MVHGDASVVLVLVMLDASDDNTCLGSPPWTPHQSVQLPSIQPASQLAPGLYGQLGLCQILVQGLPTGQGSRAQTALHLGRASTRMQVGGGPVFHGGLVMVNLMSTWRTGKSNLTIIFWWIL